MSTTFVRTRGIDRASKKRKIRIKHEITEENQNEREDDKSY